MISKIGPALERRLLSTQDYDQLEVSIFLQGEHAQTALQSVNDAGGDSRGAIETIKAKCSSEQRDLLDLLTDTRSGFKDGPVNVPLFQDAIPFWINNSIIVKATRTGLNQVMGRPDVSYIELVRHADLRELMDFAKTREKSSAPAAPPVSTWSVNQINAPLLWQLGITGSGVLAAVIDTGVNYKHPDLQNRMWISAQYPLHGYDFESNQNDPMDHEGHGTCCAGIVAGEGSSGTKTGVAPGATVMALRVGGAESTFWKAFQFAIDNRVQVVSMSMSWKYPSSPNYPGWRRTCETVLAAGILHANSIGNQGQDPRTYPIPYNIATPGNCPPPRMHPLQTLVGGLASPISCGATDDQDQLAGYSGRGPAAWERTPYTDYPYQNGAKLGLIKPDVCAPGPGTTSCNYLYTGASSGSPYVSFGGTSSATPHVGGCLVLLAHACQLAGKPIVPAQMQEALENTAVRIHGQTKSKENHYGAGRVDVYAAYKYGQARNWW